MTFNQLIKLLPKVVKYNLKIIFAGKFFWFLLAAFGFFAFFMFQSAWNRAEINEGLIYNILMFPCLLLIFYPAVFGIQNDEDSRILEILFGIPDYRYKVWGVRLLMIYVVIFAILIVFSYIAILLLYPINPFEMSLQLMFPVLFFGNLTFMFSTITRSGNGTAVLMPDNFHPMIWEGILIKNRIFLFSSSLIWMMIGLLNLQKREKFV